MKTTTVTDQGLGHSRTERQRVESVVGPARPDRRADKQVRGWIAWRTADGRPVHSKSVSTMASMVRH